MIKIALFCDSVSTKSGIIRYCDLLKSLIEKYSDCKVDVFSNLSYKRVLNCVNFYDKREIRKILLTNSYDVVHINGFISTIPYCIFSVLQSLKYPAQIVYTPHAHPFYTLNHPMRNKLFFHLFVKKILKKANTIISINKEDFDFFSKYNTNVVTIPHWKTRDLDVKQKVGNKKPIILFVGRNDSNKNLKALYELPRDEYKIICVTNIKPEREDFEYMSNLTDEELMQLYSSVSLTVIPSRYEAFSYTALESLLVGTPILVSNRVRIVDFLEGVKGVVQYNYDDKHDFNNKVKIALEQIVEVEKVKEIFSEQKAFEKYERVYKCK